MDGYSGIDIYALGVLYDPKAIAADIVEVVPVAGTPVEWVLLGALFMGAAKQFSLRLGP